MYCAAITCDVTCLLLGQSQERINDVAERFQGGGPQITATHIVVFCVLALLICLAFWRVARLIALREGHSYYSAKRLFVELCSAHGLDWHNRRLLSRLAHARAAQHPARIFVEPTWFEAADLPAALQPFHQELGALQQQLFATDTARPDSQTPN
jgi:hypothetical protein